MSDNIKKDMHEALRKRLWTEAWCATASATTCRDASAATRWADEALAEFDKRFPAPTGNPQSP